MAATLRTTTLTAAVTSTNSKQFALASVTGITLETINQGLALFVGSEYCPILDVFGLMVTVDRGQAGTAGSTHASGAAVYIGIPSHFYQYDPVGVPPESPLVTPWINTLNGNIWTVSGNAWVLSGGSGDVVGPGSSTDDNLVSFDGATGTIIQDSGISALGAASKLLGRGSASGSGAWQEITLGTNLSMSGTTVNASGGGASTLTIGTTDIASGTIGRVLYHAASDLLGEMTTTGSGTVVALATSPVLVTPTLGAATGTSVTLSGAMTARSLVATGITAVKTSDYPVVATDFTVRCDTSGGGFTVTLPAASTVIGQVVNIKLITGGNTLTVGRTGADTIDGATTITTSTTNDNIQVQALASTVWVLL